MAQITWKNVDAPDFSASNKLRRDAVSLFDKAISGVKGVGENITKARQSEVDQRTKDAITQIKGIQDLEALGQAQQDYGTLPGVADQFGVVNEGDILAQMAAQKGDIQQNILGQQAFEQGQRDETSRQFLSGFAPDINLAAPGDATTGTHTDNVAALDAALQEGIQSGAITPDQAAIKRESELSRLGLTKDREFQLLLNKYTKDGEIDTAGLSKEAKQNKFSPVDIQNRVLAEKGLSGQKAKEDAIKDLQKRNLDLKFKNLGEKASLAAKSEAERAEILHPIGMRKWMMDTYKDTDWIRPDAITAANRAVTDYTGKYPAEVIFYALNDAIEGGGDEGKYDFDKGFFEDSLEKYTDAEALKLRQEQDTTGIKDPLKRAAAVDKVKKGRPVTPPVASAEQNLRSGGVTLPHETALAQASQAQALERNPVDTNNMRNFYFPGTRPVENSPTDEDLIRRIPR